MCAIGRVPLAGCHWPGATGSASASGRSNNSPARRSALRAPRSRCGRGANGKLPLNKTCTACRTKHVPHIIYKPPWGESIINPEIERVRSIFFSSTEEYWAQGSGGVSITWADGETQAELRILHHPEHGFHLQHFTPGEHCLSLHDDRLLSAVVEAADEWLASAGLFVTRTSAWLAIEEFCQTGQRTSKINWIPPERLPEDGNW